MRSADILSAEDVQYVHVTINRFLSPGSYYTRIGARIDSVCATECGYFRTSAVLAIRDKAIVGRLSRGTKAVIRSQAMPLPRQRNPFTFDYGRYLQRKGFVAAYTITTDASIDILFDPVGLSRYISLARDRIRTDIAEHFPGADARAIMQALLLGDRTEIAESIQESFRATGLMHLLAVSGLHVLIVGFSVYKLLRGILLRIGFGWTTTERIRVSVTLFILVGYYFIAGQSLSILRALIMASVYLVQHLVKRRSQLLNGLAAAAVIILFVAPSDLNDIGFQLSFSAVASLALLNPIADRNALPGRLARMLGRRLRKLLGGMSRSIAASFAATIGTLPVLVYHFGFVSFAGIFLNLAAIPLAASTLTSGLLSVVASEIGTTQIADWLGSYAALTTTALILVTQTGSRIFESIGIEIGWPNLLSLGVAGFVLAFYATRQLLTIRWKLGIAIMAVASTQHFVNVTSNRPGLDIVFFDVGQGDAVLVRSPENRFMLIDTGPEPYRKGAMADVVQSTLRHWGDTNVDVVVLSHPHTDHIGGAADVIRSIPVGVIVDNGLAPDLDAYERYEMARDSIGVPRIVARDGEEIHLSRSVSVEILAPDSELVRDANANETSIVLRVGFGETCAILTGDIEAISEEYLVRRYGERMSCDVVKIPHHGSRTSSSPGFVGRTAVRNRTFAVASVAERNRFGLPDQEALDNWTRFGATVRTTERGAVWLRSDGRRFREINW